jgi:hypothetical protein
MKGLENLIPMASKITVYVPATTHVSKHTNNAVQIKATAELLARLFGGSTSSPALGYWVSNEQRLVTEKTTVVFAYCNEAALEDGIMEVIEYCRKLKAEMTQEAIALEVNGSMYFV